MAIRIRVYPQNGLGMSPYGMSPYGMNRGGAVSAATYFNSKLQTQRQVSSLQLGYERALWNERLEKVRLEERLKNPYAAMGTGIGGAYGVPMAAGINPLALGGLGTIGGLGGLAGGLPMGGVPLGLPIGGMPITGVPGSGQTNVTNQSSTGASQSVSNSNVLNVSNVHRPMVAPGGYPYGGFGGGGFLSGLLGALI